MAIRLTPRAALASLLALVACDQAPAPASKTKGVPTPEAIRSALFICMPQDVIHLMELADVGATHPDYAKAAQTNAERCKGAVSQLRRMGAPAQCIAAAEQLETLHWALTAGLSGKTANAPPLPIDPLSACAEAAHFPDVLMDPQATAASAAAAAAAAEATKAAEDAAAAAAEAQKAVAAAISNNR